MLLLILSFNLIIITQEDLFNLYVNKGLQHNALDFTIAAL